MIDRIKAFASGKNSLAGATLILVLTTLGSNVLGLLRDRFFAQKIPTDLLDTYFAAFRVPDIIFNILILGTVSAAFIPVFLEYREKSEKEAWRVAHSVITLALLVMTVLAVGLFVVMPNVVPVLVPEFSAEKQVITTNLARILLIQPVFFGLSYIFSGILNAMKRFAVYAIAPLLYNAAIILSTVWFADEYGVYALVWGVVAGAFLHMVVQFVAARMVGYRPMLDLNFRSAAIISILRLMIPRSVGFGAYQVTLVVFTAIASSLGGGAVAAYNFADNIQTMPTAVLGLAFVTALYPTLAEQVACRQMEEFAKNIWQGLRYLAVALLPAAVGLILLRAQVVRLILGTGHFDWDATVTTADTLGAFAIGIVASAASTLIARAFYALHETRLPTMIQIVSFVLAIGLGWWLAVPLEYGVPGLAAGLAISTTVYALCLYAWLRVRVPALRRHEPAAATLAVQLAGSLAVLTLIVQATKIGVAAFVDMERFWGVLVQTFAAVLAGGGTYWLALSLLRVPELGLVLGILRSRITGGNRPVPMPFNGQRINQDG